MWISEQTARDIFELDELYWFVERKAKGETRENIYVVTMINRGPQQIVDSAPAVESKKQLCCRKIETLEAVLTVFIDAYRGRSLNIIRISHQTLLNACINAVICCSVFLII